MRSSVKVVDTRAREMETEKGEIAEKLSESSGYKSERDGDRERREMDRKLYEAAISGDLSLLDKQLRERIQSLSTVEENPLHVASRLGRAEFVKYVLYLNQSLTGGLNSQGLSPLHLASLKGHVEVAKVLLERDPGVCFFRDKKGRTPLHVAAEKGQLEVLRVLVRAQPQAAWMTTDGGDPILHVCIHHNQFDAVLYLLELMEETRSWTQYCPEELTKEFINLKDDDGNTILHLLASKAQHEVIGYLFKIYKHQLDVNAVNIHHLTALDISMQHSINDWLKVNRILSNARARTAKDMRLDRPTAVYRKRKKTLQLEKYLEWVSKIREALIVVAILMATVTFQAGMNPPGGVWQSDDPNNKDIRAGESIMSYIDPRRYISFMIFNSLGFVASLGLIVVLVGRFFVDDKVALPMITLVWISVISILLIYTFSLSFLASEKVGTSWSPISYGWGLILIGVLLLVRFPHPVKWLFHRLGVPLLNKIHDKYQKYIFEKNFLELMQMKERNVKG